MASGVVELDLALWRKIYPQFNDIPDEVVLYWWRVACTIIGNTPDSPIPVEERELILYALLCHLLTLVQRGTEVVGSATSATQGSVSYSVSSSMDQLTNAAWWSQSQCGATAYEMLKTYWIGGWWFDGGPKY